jgi:hypothetical protein
VSEKFRGKTPNDREKAITEIISLAAQRGVTLVREDFEIPKGVLSDDQLKAASGGGGNQLVVWNPDGTISIFPR